MKITIVLLFMLFSNAALALPPDCPGNLEGLWDDGGDQLEIDIFEDHYLFFNPTGPWPIIPDGTTQTQIKAGSRLHTATCENNSLILRPVDDKDERFEYRRKSSALRVDHYYPGEEGRQIHEAAEYPRVKAAK